MELYTTELERLVAYLSKESHSSIKEIWDYYDEFVCTKLKIRLFITHIALIECKSYEEIAEELTKREAKKKPLTADAIRKRAQKATTIIADALKRRYGKK